MTLVNDEMSEQLACLTCWYLFFFHPFVELSWPTMSRLLIIPYYLLAWRFNSIVISVLLFGFCFIYSGITSVPMAFVFLLVSLVLLFFVTTTYTDWSLGGVCHVLLCLLLYCNVLIPPAAALTTFLAFLLG